jgi:transcription elongation factor GreA
MADKATHLTRDGLLRIERELEEIKGKRRMEIADRIAQAIAFGDISENSEFDEAKKEQAENESRILELESKLKNVVIIDDADVDLSKVGLGARVVLLDLEFNEEETYYLVGSSEANPMESKISNESPVGSAIMGKSKGSTVDVRIPNGGVIKYKIVDIRK